MSSDRSETPGDRKAKWMGFFRLNAGPLAVAAGAIVLLGGGLSVVDPATGVVFGLAVLAAGIVIHRLWRGPVDLSARQSITKVLLSGLAALVAVGLVAQAVPYGRDHSNPPVVQEATWDSPRTRELAVLACFDCHSNEVVYPWYSNVAPFSWAVQHHVDEGRQALNFSEFNQRQEADEAAETVAEGTMPPFYYALTHPGARLTDSEKQELIDGFVRSFGR